MKQKINSFLRPKRSQVIFNCGRYGRNKSKWGSGLEDLGVTMLSPSWPTCSITCRWHLCRHNACRSLKVSLQWLFLALAAHFSVLLNHILAFKHVRQLPSEQGGWSVPLPCLSWVWGALQGMRLLLGSLLGRTNAGAPTKHRANASTLQDFSRKAVFFLLEYVINIYVWAMNWLTMQENQRQPFWRLFTICLKNMVCNWKTENSSHTVFVHAD